MLYIEIRCFGFDNFIIFKNFFHAKTKYLELPYFAYLEMHHDETKTFEPNHSN